MITFTDQKLYLKGIGSVILMDPVTGQVRYFSNKFQTGNFQTTVTMGEIRGGLNNPVATFIPSDAGVTVDLDAADFNLEAKALQVGAPVSYNATVLACQVVTAASSALSVDVTAGTPVAAPGYQSAFAYVQQVDVGATLAQTGTPYAIDASTGAISDFTATQGVKYKVWYWVKKAIAKQATIKTTMDPDTLYCVVSFAVYANVNAAGQQGSRCGTLYGIVPRLKLGANGNLTGDQTKADSTKISGQAVAFDAETISETCEGCAGAGSDLAYYIYVPCEQGNEIQGLALIGGVVTVVKETTAYPDFRLVMEDGSLVKPDAALMSYAGSELPSGTSINTTTGLITAGSTAGDGEITATYTDGTNSYVCPAVLSVTNS